MISEESKKFLLNLARKTLENELQNKESNIENIPDEIKTKGACFVLIKVDEEERGCIGTLFAHQELSMNVIENTKTAAFDDQRFPPLTSEDLKNTEIEISIISPPKLLTYDSEKEILGLIEKNKHGVIIKQGIRIGSLLPREWSKIKDKLQFLESVCTIARLDKDAWGAPNT